MCSSRKYPYPPHGRSMEIPRGWGVLKAKILKGKYEALLEFPEGWGGFKPKNLLWVGDGYFLEQHNSRTKETNQSENLHPWITNNMKRKPNLTCTRQRLAIECLTTNYKLKSHYTLCTSNPFPTLWPCWQNSNLC